MAVFEEQATQILLKLLDRKAEQAEQEIKEKGILSEEHAIPLILKILFNHVLHLDKEVTEIKKLLNNINNRIDDIENRINNIENRIDGIENRIDGIENRIDRIENRIDGIDRKIDKKIDELKNNLIAWLSIGFGIIAALVTLFGFLK